tara:strand:- start:1987 stop:2274 length:288 start_codon:yes stop_codon:yes gene_type:complete
LPLRPAETLKAWRERFMANREKAIEIYNECFCRICEFYLAAREAGFRDSGFVVFQIQLAKKVETVLVTRNYIANDENRLVTYFSDIADKTKLRDR